MLIEDSKVSGEAIDDLEKGEFHVDGRVGELDDGLSEEGLQHAVAVSNEGNCSLGHVNSKAPKDASSCSNEPFMPSIVVSGSDTKPHNDLGLSSDKKDNSVSEHTTNMPTLVVSEGVTYSFDGGISDNDAPRKAQLSRNSSGSEQCRVCQQDKDEELITLGCQCRGELSKTHRSCIDMWFRTKGSNRCEICHHVAVNVPPPQSHSSASYWVWRVDPALRGGDTGQDRQRGGYSPLWVAFSILVGGLLLDILISLTLGVTALPVNIIIGVIVVLGLGTAFRLAVELFLDRNVGRVSQRTDPIVPFGRNPAL